MPSDTHLGGVGTRALADLGAPQHSAGRVPFRGLCRRSRKVKDLLFLTDRMASLSVSLHSHTLFILTCI